MSTRIAKEEMALMMPNSLSNYAPFAPSQARRPAHGGFVQSLADGFRWLVELPRRRAVMAELAMLSDHELSDIGLSRAELPRVFDPAFIATRETGRRSA